MTLTSSHRTSSTPPPSQFDCSSPSFDRLRKFKSSIRGQRGKTISSFTTVLVMSSQGCFCLFFPINALSSHGRWEHQCRASSQDLQLAFIMRTVRSQSRHLSHPTYAVIMRQYARKHAQTHRTTSAGRTCVQRVCGVLASSPEITQTRFLSPVRMRDSEEEARLTRTRRACGRAHPCAASIR